MALPGQELVERGIEDLRRGEATAEALPLALYELPRREHGDDPHGRYNALVRRERALG